MGISSAMGSQALVPAGFGFRNLIINGDFRINQRGFTSTTTTATYGFDRWFGQWSGGTVTYSSQAFTVGNPIEDYEPTNFARLVTASQTGAASDFARLEQRIESVRTLSGQTATISFWAKAGSGTPKVAIEFQQYFGTGGSPSASVTNYVGQVTLSTSWTRYVLTYAVPSISGKTIGTNNNDFIGLYFYTSAGSDWNARTGSLGVQNITVDFWGVQVEANNVPTSFENRPIGVELQLCQRYYEDSGYQTYSVPTAVTGQGAWIPAASAYTLCSEPQFRTTKRATPTVTIYNSNTLAAGSVSEYLAGGAFVTNRTAFSAYPSTTKFGVHSAGQLATGRDYNFSWKAESEL